MISTKIVLHDEAEWARMAGLCLMMPLLPVAEDNGGHRNGNRAEAVLVSTITDYARFAKCCATWKARRQANISARRRLDR